MKWFKKLQYKLLVKARKVFGFDNDGCPFMRCIKCHTAQGFKDPLLNDGKCIGCKASNKFSPTNPTWREEYYFLWRMFREKNYLQ